MFSSVGLPHGFCFLWNPGLLWLHVLSDGLIALAYFLIPLALLRIVVRRRDIPFNGAFFCFAAFIIACGATHVMEVVTLWHPVYWISGVLKAVTAVISFATFVVLLRITPDILALAGTPRPRSGKPPTEFGAGEYFGGCVLGGRQLEDHLHESEREESSR